MRVGSTGATERDVDIQVELDDFGVDAGAVDDVFDVDRYGVDVGGETFGVDRASPPGAGGRERSDVAAGERRLFAEVDRHPDGSVEVRGGARERRDIVGRQNVRVVVGDGRSRDVDDPQGDEHVLAVHAGRAPDRSLVDGDRVVTGSERLGVEDASREAPSVRRRRTRHRAGPRRRIDDAARDLGAVSACAEQVDELIRAVGDHDRVLGVEGRRPQEHGECRVR